MRDVGNQWGGDISFNQAFGNQTGLVFLSNVGITQAVAFVAPYFRTISPTFLQLEAGRCERAAA